MAETGLGMGRGEGTDGRVELLRAGCEYERVVRRASTLKMFSPAIEKVPMMSTRISQTMIATKTGTALVKVTLLTTEPAPKLL